MYILCLRIVFVLLTVNLKYDIFVKENNKNYVFFMFLNLFNKQKNSPSQRNESRIQKLYELNQIQYRDFPISSSGLWKTNLSISFLCILANSINCLLKVFLPFFNIFNIQNACFTISHSQRAPSNIEAIKMLKKLSDIHLLNIICYGEKQLFTVFKSANI